MLKVRWIAPLTQDLHRSRKNKKIKVSLLNTTEWNVYQIKDGNAKILKKKTRLELKIGVFVIHKIFADMLMKIEI